MVFVFWFVVGDFVAVTRSVVVYYHYRNSVRTAVFQTGEAGDLAVRKNGDDELRKASDRKYHLAFVRRPQFGTELLYRWSDLLHHDYRNSVWKAVF